MKKLLFGLIFVLFVNCKSQITNLSELNYCLSKKDIAVLENGLKIFELELSKKYLGVKKEESYIRFLTDFVIKDIPPSFFLNPELKTIRSNVKGVGIWELSTESDENMESEIKLKKTLPKENTQTITLKTDFQNCLIKVVSNEGIKKLLTLRTKVPNLSWGLNRKILNQKLTEKDFKEPMNRLVIAYAIYYEFALNLEK